MASKKTKKESTKKTVSKKEIKKEEKDYLKEFLEEVISIIVGRSSEQIADLLYTNKHVNEFLIAKKLDLTINQTRNILYKISDHGLVSWIRKKDKKKGWYTYFWKINVVRSLEFLRGILQKHISNLENQIKSREEKQFYECKNCKKEFSEENSLHYDFQCTECGRVLTLKNNKRLVNEYKKELEKMQKRISLVNEEIEKERKKDKDKEMRKSKKEQKKKAEKRKKAAKKARSAKTKKAAKKAPVKKKSPAKKSKKASKKTKKKSAKKPTAKKRSVTKKKKAVKKKKPAAKKKPAKKSTSSKKKRKSKKTISKKAPVKKKSPAKKSKKASKKTKKK